MPEHGFLPGKKLEFYSTINKYDFANSRFRVEVYDDRTLFNFNRVDCSDILFTNTSEFSKPDCINLLAKYVDTLLYKSNALIDSSSTDTIQIRLEGIDSRLIGYGKIRAHGLCQLKAKYHNFSKTYCIDITDADKNSPVGPNAFLTRKTATRIIGLAAMREVIEAFFKDLSSFNNSWERNKLILFILKSNGIITLLNYYKYLWILVPPTNLSVQKLLYGCMN